MSKLIQGVTQFDPGTVRLIIHLILFCTLLVAHRVSLLDQGLFFFIILTMRGEKDNFEEYGEYSGEYHHS